MVFYPPAFVPNCPEIPDTANLYEFMFNEKHGRYPISKSRDPYVDGLGDPAGQRITAAQQKDRVDSLSRALVKELGWQVNQGSEFDKVAGIFAYNTVDVMTLNWAIHRLNGVSTPANAVYTADELRHQMSNSGATSLFTSLILLPTALKAAAKCNIPKEKIYIIESPGDTDYPKDHKRLGQLIEAGSSLPDVEPLQWSKGQGKKQTAFLCYSSGTTGLAKGVMISHYNVIANTIQICTYDKPFRDSLGKDYVDTALGLLPYSHIYGLIVVCHAASYRGDEVIVLPKFEMQNYLKAIQNFKINTLYIVPPIIIQMVKQKQQLQRYDLSSVVSIFTGAAPLAKETAEELGKQYPRWKVRQGYGLTETCTVTSSTSPFDIWFGSSGCLVPGYEAKLMSIEGNEITGYDQPGELLVKSPTIVLGYLKNEKATRETFVDMPEGRFMRTGDEAVFKVSPKGNEHLWIVDRIKELIKVKGLQVAPAELEGFLLDHPAVADCAVIPVHDDDAGEVPKAFVVKSPEVGLEDSDAMLKRSIQKYVEKEKARHKWLKGGVEFIDVIPKSASGKILRRLLRDKERETRRKAGAKI